jgi:tryptophan synthase alpha chain
MSRIAELFKKKSGNILNVYCTAGYPQLDSTVEVMKALQESGADIIELGIPYSDPLADGPVIQMSNAVALKNGMTISKLFEQLKDFRKNPSFGGAGEVMPVVLMGYLNPILQYGFEKFCADASATGIDGLIIPDLSEYEFEKEYSTVIKKFDLDFVFLVTPETSDERIKKLDSLSSGFLYAVSSSSTTGADQDLKKLETYLVRLKNLKLRNPVLAGFGIKDRLSFATACRYASGAVIGSAYIKALKNNAGVHAATRSFLASVLG